MSAFVRFPIWVRTLSRPVLVLLVTVVLLVAMAIPALASLCPYSIDCTWPDSQACQTNPDSTVDTEPVPGLGTLELRYDSGCRTVWARSPYSLQIDNLFALRSTSGGCEAGTTSGLSWGTAYPTYMYSRQLNDANCLGRAKILYFGTYYQTDWY